MEAFAGVQTRAFLAAGSSTLPSCSFLVSLECIPVCHGFSLLQGLPLLLPSASVIHPLQMFLSAWYSSSCLHCGGIQTSPEEGVTQECTQLKESQSRVEWLLPGVTSLTGQKVRRGRLFPWTLCLLPPAHGSTQDERKKEAQLTFVLFLLPFLPDTGNLRFL